MATFHLANLKTNSDPGLTMGGRMGLVLALAVGIAWPAASSQARIYWLEFTGLHSANADGTDAKTLVSLNDGPDGVAVDQASGKVYWTNMGSGGSGSLQRANLDGSNVEYVVPKGGTYFPKQLQLDLAHGKAYWSDRDGLKIQRCNLDGSQNEVLISGLKNPVGMALDIAKGFFYFSEKNGGTLRRAPMAMPSAGQTAATRKDVDTLISGLTQPIDVAVDLDNGKIYWTDRDEGTVHRAGIEIPAGQSAASRKDMETLMKGLNTPIGVALDLANGKLYTTESGTGAIFRANLDGTGKEAVIPARVNATLTGICFVGTNPTVSLPALSPGSLRPGFKAFKKNLDMVKPGDPEREFVDAVGARINRWGKNQAYPAVALPMPNRNQGLRGP